MAIDLINGSIRPDPKDPQLYARARRESEAKRAIRKAEREVLEAARKWHASDQGFTRIALRMATQKWLDVSEVKAKC